MPIAFRAATSQGNASGGALTVAKPAGVADGDLLVAHAYLETDANSWASVGAGFASAASGVNTGLFRIQAWWKIAAGEPASWTWTPTTTGVWRTVVVAAYSGVAGSGVDVAGATGQADAVIVTSQTAPSITTTVAGDLVLCCYGNDGLTNPTAYTGFTATIRVARGGLTIADATQATAGATGTSRPSAGPGTQSYAAFHYAMLAAAPGGAATFPPWPARQLTTVRM